MNSQQARGSMRLIEATQFVVTEYQQWAESEAKPEKPTAKTKAFEKLEELTKNPKSEVAALGGLDNIRRVRVLRDADDTELKDLVLKFETKVSPDTLRTAKKTASPTTSRPVNRRAIAVFVPNMKARLVSNIHKVIELAKFGLLEDVMMIAIKSIEDSDITDFQSNSIIREMLIGGMQMCSPVDGNDEEREARFRKAFGMLDWAQSLLALAGRGEVLFDRAEFMTFHKVLTRPKISNRPPQKTTPTAA